MSSGLQPQWFEVRSAHDMRRLTNTLGSCVMGRARHHKHHDVEVQAFRDLRRNANALLLLQAARAIASSEKLAPDWHRLRQK
jgi:hypothetical protein